MMKHETSEHNQMKTSQGSRKSLIIAHQPSEARGPSERALHHPSSGQQDEAALGLGQFDDFQLHAMRFGLLSRCIAGVALVNESEFDRLPGDLLDRLSQFTYLSTVLLVSRRDQQGQQIAQRIDGCMHFAAFASLSAIIASTASTFRGRLQGSTIENGRRGLPLPTLRFPQQQAQV